MKADDIENIRMFSRVVIVLVWVYDGKDDGNLLVQNELICDMLWIPQDISSTLEILFTVMLLHGKSVGQKPC